MGLFGEKQVCSICGGKLSILTRIKIADGFMCPACRAQCVQYLDMPAMWDSGEIESCIRDNEANKSLYNVFSPTVEMHGLNVDFKNKLWCVATKKQIKTQTAYIFRFDEVTSYDFDEDGKTISKSGAASAIAGGLLFGGIGAVAGGLTGRKTKDVINKLSIIIQIGNKWASSVEVKVITAETKKGSWNYNLAKNSVAQIAKALDRILAENQTATAETFDISF